jgi:hypothetical protein
VRFKGIAAYVDRQKNDYHTVADKDFTVEFRDANGKEISKLTLRSNRFGSFQGSFIAPTDRVLGTASIICSNQVTSVRIEEYKRPKFSVEVGAAKEPPRLNQNVTVVAKATAYTGAAIDGAKVKWKVTRSAQWPTWSRWCWWFLSSTSSQKQIAHGTAVTNAKGEVEVTFLAQPDLSIDPKQEPTFVYEVAVDVTDSTGEARSGSRAVRAAYVDLAASMGAGEWLEAADDVVIKVDTRSIDGEPLPAKGTISVHRLKQPEQVIRAPLSNGFNPRGYMSEAQPVKNPSDPNSWELDELVQKIDFATDDKGVADASCKLEAGEYRAILETTDRAGKKVTALLPLRVLDLTSKSFSTKVAHHFSAKSWNLQPGDDLVAVWGTGYDEGRFYYEIEHRGVVLRKGWSDGKSTQEVIRFPITEEHRGGLSIRTMFQKQNRSYLRQHMVYVPWSNKQLTMRFESMRDKLQPGAKETWKVRIEGAEKDAVEMMGALYDASLDAFLQHHWMQGFSQYFYRDSSSRTGSTF